MCPTCEASFERADGMTLCPNDGSPLLPDLGRDDDDDDDDDEFTADDSLVGVTLPGGIQLVDIAGEGAMGTVYEGWQAEMERRVAVKMLHADLVNEAGFLERFIREARAVARLNHPNIVTVHTIGEQRGSPYLVLEYVEGETIAEVISADGPLAPTRTIRIARQIASALADAHAAGIIHRDLKPSNVILTQRRRADDFVKLLDFGVAKMTDAGSTLTRDGFVFGTPAYLSPEQANGVGLDPRSDLYSLGVCMFEMLTKTLPFSGNQVQLLLKHAREAAPPIRDRGVALPAALADLVDALLAKNPDDRPSSAEALADALDAIVGDRAPSPWASTALPAQTRVAYGEPIASENDSPTRSFPPPRQPRLLLLALAAIALLGAGAGSAALLLRAYLPLYPLAANHSQAAVAVPDKPQGTAASGQVDNSGERRALSFSTDGGYSLRINIPAELYVGVNYELLVDVWAPNGDPLAEPQLVTHFVEPQGQRPFFAKSTGPGEFAIRRRFDDVGPYTFEVYPPTSGDPIGIQFEVLETQSHAAP